MEAELDRTGRGRYGNLEYMEENCDCFFWFFWILFANFLT